MIRFFATHPTAANLLMILLLALGLVTLPTLKRETFPDFTAQEVQAQILYPGASAEDIEEAICQRLEDAVDAVTDIDEVRCEAREGIATMVAKMRTGGDIDRFLDDVKSEVEAIDNFPEQAETPIIQQLGRSDQVVSIALSGPMPAADLKAYAEQLKDRLQKLPEVSQVTIQGFSDHQLRVEIPAHALHQYGLSMSDIAAIISQQNLKLPAGGIETHEQDLLLRFADERHSARELAELIVLSGSNGTELRLGDFATITDRFERDEEKIIFNGERAALLQITKTKAEDTLNVVNSVKTFVERERLSAPPQVSITLTQDVASIVSDRLQLLTKNGWQGLLLVFLAMWLFFQLRFAFWVAMGLPVAFLGGLFFMSVFGYSINMLSMVALLIALGLLMDDAIVIAENIATKLQQGESAYNAAVDGTREVAPGVISSFLTTIAVFGPLAFLEGDIGKVLKVIPVVLILVISISLIEAFFILPHHLAHSMAHANLSQGRFRRGFESGLHWFRENIIGRIVDAVLHARYFFIGLVIAVFMISVGMLAGGHLKFQAFPSIDGDVIEARILLPQGTPLWRTETVVEQIVNALQQVDQEYSERQSGQPDQQKLVKNISVQFAKNADSFESGAHLATITADLLTAEQRTVSIDQILQSWRDKTGTVTDVISLNFKEPALGPAGLAIDIRLQGEDLTELKAASLELQQWLARYRGVLDLSDDLRPGKTELRLRLRDGALALGTNARDIASQLQTGFQGTTASEIQVAAESYEIDVQLSAEAQQNLDELADFPISTADGDQIPLLELVFIETGRGYARINRIDGQRTVIIQGDVDTRIANAAQIMADTSASFLPELQKRYPELRIALEGQAEETSTTGTSLARGFIIGLLGIFILLSFQFRSYSEPLVVMVAIPLALIGVIWGHLLMGLELSMPSMMGFVSLAGIVVNDSILLVTFLKLRRADGLAALEAAKRASRERFRAVLLTSLTTIVGLLPLLSEKSLQAQVLIPLVTSIVFGLLVTTILVLLVVPALYLILHDFSAKPDSEQSIAGEPAG